LTVGARASRRRKGVSGIAVGVIVALAGAFANYFLGQWRDDKRWEREQKQIRQQREHERRIQSEHWEREERTRFQSERLKAYRDMHRAASLESLGLYYNPFTASYQLDVRQSTRGLEQVRLCRDEILLIAYSNEVREAAGRIEGEAFVLYTKLSSNFNDGDEIKANQGNGWNTHIDLLVGASQDFIEAVRAEQKMEDWGG
jgi:hypothetical protein